jgi:hypothetical protein
MKCTSYTADLGRPCSRTATEDFHGKQMCKAHRAVAERNEVHAYEDKCGMVCPHPGNVKRMYKCTVRHRRTTALPRRLHSTHADGRTWIWQGNQPSRNWARMATG